MTIGSAKKFIKQAQVDTDLRRALNKAKTHAILLEQLEENGFSFSAHDFDEAFHNTLFECQFEEHANQLKEMKAWWELLQGILGVQETSSSCGPCSIKSSCNLGSCSSS